MTKDLESMKLGLLQARRIPSRLRTAASTTAALLAFLAVGVAREARADQLDTYIFIWNNTNATLTFPAANASWPGSPGSTFSGQNNEWEDCDAQSYWLGSTIWLFPMYPAPGDQVETEPFPPFISSAPHPGPAGTLAPGYVTAFEAGTNSADIGFGTGGTIIYTWTDPNAPTTGPGSGVIYQGVINWSDTDLNAAGDTNSSFTCNNTIQACPPSGFGEHSCGPLGQSLPQSTAGDVVTVNGSGCGTLNDIAHVVSVEIDDWTPMITAPPPVLSGYPNQGITIHGKNFDTTGLTQIFFSGVAVNTTCPTREECSAVVPPNTTGVEPVTISVNGRSVNVGNFTYLPPGPECTYSTVTGDVDFINTNCVDDSLGDAITIYYYEQYDGDGPGWAPVYDYSGSQELETLGTAEAGLSYTFVGCYTVNGVPALPGSLGCDSPTQVTIPPPFVVHSTPVHFVNY